MTDFNGPWSSNLEALRKSIESIPDQYKESFENASTSVHKKICDPDVLHVWESDSDLDSLLQLTSVIARICDLGVRKNKDINKKGPQRSMLIIASHMSSRDNFRRICELVSYLTEAPAIKQLEGAARIYGKVVVIKGWDNTRSPTATGNKEAAEKVVKCINIAIDNTFDLGSFTGTHKKIVWHSGPTLSFLLHWIDNTTSILRSALTALTITGSLILSSTLGPSPSGRANTLSDLQRLHSYTSRLSIPAIFLDPSSQLLIYPNLSIYMYYFAYYISTLLPQSLVPAAHHAALDELLTFSFRVYSAATSSSSSSTVRNLKARLPARLASSWAKKCTSPTSYERSVSRAAASDTSIHLASLLADTPFTTLTTLSSPPSPPSPDPNSGLPAFSRLAAGPAALGDSTMHICTPVHIDWANSRLRPSAPASLYILLPGRGVRVQDVTSGVQGIMMGVLERVRQDKGDRVSGRIGHGAGAGDENGGIGGGQKKSEKDKEREVWSAVKDACTWALTTAKEKGRLPEGVGVKLDCVVGRMRDGSWARCLGAEGAGSRHGAGNSSKAGAGAGAGGVGGIDNANQPLRSYGFGQYAAPAGVGQANGMLGYAAAGHTGALQTQQQAMAGYAQPHTGMSGYGPTRPAF